jgi:diguanylate cyclase (GGDEF)-like protein
MSVFSHWPRRFAYPAAGILLSVALVAGLLALQGGLAQRVPNATSWILAELRQQPFVYAYLMVATLAMMTILGWIVGRKEDLLEELSVTDPLTGLANRRRMRAAAADELNRSARYGTPLALLLIDLDRLKEINDRHGHGNGDRALELVADGLRRSCRATDVAARFGGDEFVVLAVNTTAIEALALAHRIRAAVKRGSAVAAARVRQDAQIHHTVSIGVADLDAAALPSFDALHAAADRALYAAKLAGRDRATAAPAKDAVATPEPTALRGAGEGAITGSGD